MLVKPAIFEFNPQTSVTNAFQSKVTLSPDQTYQAALKNLNDLYKVYKEHGISVEIFESIDKTTPDAIFPNCVSTFPGSVFEQEKPVAILHPMHHPNRRAERSEALIQFFRGLGYTIIDDLLKYEAQGLALEGTGSVVMDHLNKIAYCALSPRSDLVVAQDFADMIGYRLETFITKNDIYHTDLIMNICSGFSEVALPVIVSEDQPRILKSLRDRREDVIQLNERQFNAFCGNSLEIRNDEGNKFFSTSTRALKARTPEQVAIIEKHVSEIIHAKVRMVERVGGGSDRCLTQELHGLPPAPSLDNKLENLSITASR
jgi:hypothetical protein